MEAITYQKKHLVQWQETHAAQINQASALLAYTPATAFGPYKVSMDRCPLTCFLLIPLLIQRLYDPARWSTLVQSFRVAIYNLSTLPTEPLLHLAMYAGLASLKLPTCYDHKTMNVDCPTCDPDLGSLAKEVPFSHHLNSTIVCSITGRIMNEDNSPMAFPQNGSVYSREVSFLFRLWCGKLDKSSFIDRPWKIWRRRTMEWLLARDTKKPATSRNYAKSTSHDHILVHCTYNSISASLYVYRCILDPYLPGLL